jgi:pimeloyl-ACP methyl ester carboxylesterase
MAPIQLQVRGATLHGERRESRYADVPPLVALHAGVADSRSWSAAFDLCEGMPTLVAYDRRGYGASPLPDAGYDSLDDLAGVLDQTTSGPVWLLGNSLGGRLALDLAVTQPQRVAGLILLSPGVSGAPEMQFDETTALLFDGAERAFEAGDLAEVAAIEAQIWLDGPAAAEGRVGGATRSLALEMNTVALASDTERGRLERDPGIPAWDRLQRLTMPVTVVCGLLDVGAVIDEGRAIADRIPGARFTELEDVAHLPALEAPERVAGLVRRAVLAA